MAILPFWVEDRGKGVKPFAKPPRFLFVGRMDPDKGFRHLVPAFESLRKRNPQVALDICGSGDPNQIAELRRLSAGVEAKGNISDNELDAKLRACFAVVLPSLHEGYPLTLLEACSYGKPFVASSVGSISEIFSNRKCAILVPPGDTAALEKAMETLVLEDAAIYSERAADARLAFEELSTSATILAALTAAYNPLPQNSSKP
jgi:glycosyltransferase involved in cell wall biosynthesis